MAKLTGYTKVAVIEQGDSWSGMKDYYYALYDDGFIYQPGDSVLVSGGARNSVWEIKEIISSEEAAEKCKKNITAEVICKVDTSAYEERVSRRKAAESIKSKMTQMVKKMDEEMKYEMYASKNAEFASMYAKYKELLK